MACLANCFDRDGLVEVQAFLFSCSNYYVIALLALYVVDISFPGNEKVRICVRLLSWENSLGVGIGEDRADSLPDLYRFGVLFVCRTCSFSLLEHGFGSTYKDCCQ